MTDKNPRSSHSPLGDFESLPDPKKLVGVGTNFINKVFGTQAYFRLFGAQFVTSLGDWLGLIAISVTASRVGGGSPETAVGLVLAARLVPGFFLAPLAGVVADRLDRRKLMVICDAARGGVLLYLPFVDTVWQLVLVSLVLEIFTLLWIPSKDATLPDLLPKNRLATANSLSLIATFGTFPLASFALLILAPIANSLEDVSALTFLRIDDTSLAFYVDSLTFFASALLVFSISKYVNTKPKKKKKQEHLLTVDEVTETLSSSAKGFLHSIKATVQEFKEGWKYISVTPIVKGVNVGMATALLGGGMLIPLGIIYTTEILDAGTAGYAGMQTALGVGAGLGVLALLFVRHRTKAQDVVIFYWVLFGAGISLALVATIGYLFLVVVLVGLLGMCAGGMYVVGFTLLHERVTEDLRGRVFASLI